MDHLEKEELEALATSNMLDKWKLAHAFHAGNENTHSFDRTRTSTGTIGRWSKLSQDRY